jgi:tellurite resistance protein
MDRALAMIALIDDPSLPPLEPHPADEALFSIAIHVAFADGTVEEQEFELLQRLLPHRSPEDLLLWVATEAEQPLAFDMLRLALPTEEASANALRFGARMAWSDGEIAPGESMVLLRVSRALGLPDNVVRTVVRELVG